MAKIRCFVVHAALTPRREGQTVPYRDNQIRESVDPAIVVELGDRVDVRILGADRVSLAAACEVVDFAGRLWRAIYLGGGLDEGALVEFAGVQPYLLRQARALEFEFAPESGIVSIEGRYYGIRLLSDACHGRV